MLMGLRAYARHRHEHLSAIQRALARGQIVKTADAQIDSDQADRMWAEWEAARQPAPTSPLFDAVPELGALDPARPAPVIEMPRQLQAPATAGGGIEKPEQKVSETEARRRKEVALAIVREIEAEEKTGRVIPVDQVDAAWGEIRAKIKSSILRLPDKCAPRLAALSDAREVRAALHAECEAILRNLSDDLLRAAE